MLAWCDPNSTHSLAQSGSIQNQSTSIQIGCRAVDDNSRYFNGIIDEVRISTISRSNSWIKATYYSNSDNLIEYSSYSTLDADSDGITDFDEATIYGTDPTIADTDNDGINDGVELAYWGSDWNADYDNAGIINLLDPDSDNDGILDSDQGDVDEDGMLDWWEIKYGLDPSSNDADGDIDNDGFSNIAEFKLDTVPNDEGSLPSVTTIYDYDSKGQVEKYSSVVGE